MLTYLAPLLFLLLWSGGFTVAKIGISYADPLTLLALRYACVVGLLIPFCIILRPRLPASRSEFLHVCFVGFLIQCLYFGTAYLAFAQGVSAGGVAIITSLQPILVALIIPMWARESVSAIRWIGLLLGLTGAVVVITANASIQIASTAGLLLAVTALLGITLATLWEKKFGTEQHPLTANLIQYSIGVVFTLPVAWYMESMHIEWTAPFVLALVYLVIGNSLLAISLLLMMIRRREASKVSALFFLVPPVSALIAWPVLGERMTLLGWAGMIITATGVYLVMRRTASIG
ncbi:MAG: DMT family transporter [Granulosicoccus sp.]|nr:DMT family transporter [Granulosicoccus sp.]